MDPWIARTDPRRADRWSWSSPGPWPTWSWEAGELAFADHVHRRLERAALLVEIDGCAASRSVTANDWSSTSVRPLWRRSAAGWTAAPVSRFSRLSRRVRQSSRPSPSSSCSGAYVSGLRHGKSPSAEGAAHGFSLVRAPYACAATFLGYLWRVVRADRLRGNSPRFPGRSGVAGARDQAVTGSGA